MSTTPYAVHIRSLRRLLPVAASLALGLLLAPAPGLWGQSAAAPSPSQPAVQFEVLDVSTGSGSKPQATGGGTAGGLNAQGGGLPANGQTPVIPAVPTALPGVTPTPPRVLTPEQREIMEKNAPLISALEQWHRQTLRNYSLDVTRLSDPFMPIKEVRSSTEDESPNAIDLSLPAILRLDLSQLRLVAITTLSDRTGALASFEDGAGNSYILRQGERIGRNNGRIVKITPSIVTVEETGRTGKEKPRVTEIKLSVLSNEGVTITQ